MKVQIQFKGIEMHKVVIILFTEVFCSREGCNTKLLTRTPRR